MARDDSLSWPTLAELTAAVRAFLDPVLGANSLGRWQPHTWRWVAR